MDVIAANISGYAAWSSRSRLLTPFLSHAPTVSEVLDPPADSSSRKKRKQNAVSNGELSTSFTSCERKTNGNHDFCFIAARHAEQAFMKMPGPPWGPQQGTTAFALRSAA